MTKNFVVIEQDPIVSMDLEGTLGGHYPDATVAVTSTLETDHAVRDTFGSDTILFVRGTLVSVSDTLLNVVRFAVSRGSQIVVLGHSDRLDVPATLLELPFTTTMVIAAADRAASSERDGSLRLPFA